MVPGHELKRTNIPELNILKQCVCVFLKVLTWCKQMIVCEFYVTKTDHSSEKVIRAFCAESSEDEKFWCW